MFTFAFPARIPLTGLRAALISITFLVLSACGTTNHVMISKADFAAAEQCLIAQQQYQPMMSAQQDQLKASLEVLRESLELHQQHTSLRDYLRAAADGLPVVECPQPPEAHYQQTITDRQMDKQIVGEMENILFTNLNVIKRARIDTGATTSSLDAQNIQIFERNGEEWVRFEISNPESDEPLTLERKRVRRVLITQANLEEPERRPVIELRVTLGRITQVAEFTLSDRAHLEFPVLIGRNILRDVMLVDVSKVNFAPLVPPAAKGQAAQ